MPLSKPFSLGKKIFLLSLSILFTSLVFSQSTIRILNNSDLDWTLDLSISGDSMAPSSYSLLSDSLLCWAERTNVFNVERDPGNIGDGEQVIYTLTASNGGTSLDFSFRLTGSGSGSTLKFSAESDTYQSGWQSDGSFYNGTFLIGSDTYSLKFKADSDDSNSSMDVTYAIHKDVVYEIPATELNNKNVLNVMAYNLQMLPLGISGMGQASLRGSMAPSHFSANQDVVIICEAFDPQPRNNDLTPAMQAQGFGYNSGILNDYFPWNGGVIIYSRWPIEKTDEYDFELCGPSSADCFANKGIKYARINKLGKKYHVFGTHMDAGSGEADITAKNLQFAEMRDFIRAQNIPSCEGVVFGGDFNVRPVDDNDLFPNFLDSIHPIIPHSMGFFESTFSKDTFDIIDHVWGSREHLIPTASSNKIITFRGIEDEMWGLFDFSDHRTVLGHFEYPDLANLSQDTTLCPGENLTLNVSSDIQTSFSWFHSGVLIPGMSQSTLSLSNLGFPDDGLYECQMGYQVKFGTSQNPLIQVFYPNGPDIVDAKIMKRVCDLLIGGLAACPLTSIGTNLSSKIEVFPNPTQALINISGLDSDHNTHIEVLDLQGRVVVDEIRRNESLSVDLTGLSRGRYLLKVQHNGGVQSFGIERN